MTTPTKEQPKPNTIAYIYWMIKNWGNSPKQGKIWLKCPVAEGTERLGGQAITRKCLLERGRLAN